MIHPSYTELIEAINREAEEGETDTVLNSRYSLVLATSKRARQLIAGAKPLVKGAAGKKPLSVAIEELYQGKVKILPPKEEEEDLTLEDHPIPTIEGYNTAYFEDDTEGYDDEASGDEDYDDEYKEDEEDEGLSLGDAYLGDESEEDD